MTPDLTAGQPAKKPEKNKLKYSKEGRDIMKAARLGGGGSGSISSFGSAAAAATANGSQTNNERRKAFPKHDKGKGNALADDNAGGGANQNANKKKKSTGFRIGPKPAPGVYTGKGELGKPDDCLIELRVQ